MQRAAYFRKMNIVASLDVFGLVRQSGLARRPIWKTLREMQKYIAAVSIFAKSRKEELHHRMPKIAQCTILWRPNTEVQCLAASSDLIEQRIQEAKVRKTDVLNTVSDKCKTLIDLQHGNTDQHSRRRPKVGPCCFGHLSTSGRDNKRKVRWNAVPRPSPWPNIAAGSSICQKMLELTTHITQT